MGARCDKCEKLSTSINTRPRERDPGHFPSTVELAYMVNLEYYYVDTACVHNIPEDENARVKIEEMVEFLDTRQWEAKEQRCNNGFTCTSFVNRPAKQLVIVHRGTENLLQGFADADLFLRQMSTVTRNAIKNADEHTLMAMLSHALIEEKDGRISRNDFSVTVTGHSLGGWLAQMCALLCKYPRLHPALGGRRLFISSSLGKENWLDKSYDLHCVAFDCPGASAVLQTTKRVCYRILLGSDDEVWRALQRLDITEYLTNRNVVNACGRHVGQVVNIDVMADETRWDPSYWNPLAPHSMSRILVYFIKQYNRERLGEGAAILGEFVGCLLLALIRAPPGARGAAVREAIAEFVSRRAD